MDFFRFLFTKRFLRHLLMVIAAAAVLLFGISMWLGWYTGHKKYIIVPDLKGKLMSEVISDEQFRDFQFELIDSVYESGIAPGTIINQEPAMNSNVKAHRKIYLTVVSSVPEMVTLPDLKYLTLRQATSMLESYGLKLGTISYTRSFDQDAVQAEYFEGKPVKAGERVYKGSIIDLVVGLGSGAKQEPQVDEEEPEIQDTLADEL
jgi:eukaryotic-like serine/threonine-protein kinase